MKGKKIEIGRVTKTKKQKMYDGLNKKEQYVTMLYDDIRTCKYPVKLDTAKWRWDSYKQKWYTMNWQKKGKVTESDNIYLEVLKTVSEDNADLYLLMTKEGRIPYE